VNSACGSYSHSLAPKYSFAADAFNPFFDHLYDVKEPSADPKGNSIFDEINDRFTRAGGSETTILTFFPTTSGSPPLSRSA